MFHDFHISAKSRQGVLQKIPRGGLPEHLISRVTLAHYAPITSGTLRCTPVLIGDAKCDHVVKAALTPPRSLHLQRYLLSLGNYEAGCVGGWRGKSMKSGSRKPGQVPDLLTHLHQWHLEDSCLNQLVWECLPTGDFLSVLFVTPECLTEYPRNCRQRTLHDRENQTQQGGLAKEGDTDQVSSPHTQHNHAQVLCPQIQ